MKSSTFLLEGQEYYSKKNYLLAFESWNKGAMHNDLDCMWKIFDFLYLDGELAFEDDAPILAYAELSAAEDATRAWHLGEFYLDEVNNLEKGIEWLIKAAKLNPRFAEKLGDLFATPNSIIKNMTQALYWWEQASKIDGTSAYNLSEKYRKGNVLAKDINLSLEWAKQGAKLT